jgi:hypothetical protein
MRREVSTGHVAGRRDCPETFPSSAQRIAWGGTMRTVPTSATPEQLKEFVDTKCGAGYTIGGDPHSSGGFDAIHGTMAALSVLPAGE